MRMRAANCAPAQAPTATSRIILTLFNILLNIILKKIFHILKLNANFYSIGKSLYVVVPGRNQTLFRYVFQAHYHTVMQNFR